MHLEYSAGFVLGPTEPSEYLPLKRGKCESCPSGPIRRSDGISPEGSTPLDLGAELSAPGSPSRPPLAGVAEASAPRSLPTASTGDASGEGSESSLAQPDAALSPVFGAAPRSGADAPEAASSTDSADSQPQGSVSGSGASGDGACLAADAPEASPAAPGAPRFSSVRWEDIVTAGTDRTVRQVQESAHSHFLALARLVVDLNRRPPLRTDYELDLDQRLEAAGSLSDVVDALAPIPRSPAPWEYELTELRGGRFTGGARTFSGPGSTTLTLVGSSWLPSLRWNRAPKLPRSSSSDAVDSTSLWRTLTRSSSKTGSNSRSASPRTPPSSATSSGTSGGAAATSGSSTSLTVDSDTSDDSGPIISSALHKGKGKRPAKSSAKLRSAPSPPKKKQQLGRPSVDLKAWKAAKQAASTAVSSSGPSQSIPSSLPAASISTSTAPVSGIAVSADSDVLSFASIPSGSDPPFSPIPRTPASPVSSTAPTASLPSSPGGPSGITPGIEASVPVETGDDGGCGAAGAASEASVVPGGVLASPVVSQGRCDGRPTRAASTTAGRRSMGAAENEAAPDALVLGLARPSRTPAATQASVVSSAFTPDPDDSAAVVAAASAAVVTSVSARRRVANTHTSPIPPARVVATPIPRQASVPRARAVVTATLSTMPGTRSTAFEPVTAIPAPIQGPQPRVRASRKPPDLANPLLEPAFTAPGDHPAWLRDTYSQFI
ncbi:unnamed protein product [Phytophthora fragariaefolia]|uniref:Unnamed protein product n=1 Tax=Phytophthora fragariaefolia TaxID=1490495 RepID=A0A9W6XVM4_9STRA|nr:unnamed protein product [Phytophthora fragariaefolia]